MYEDSEPIRNTQQATNATSKTRSAPEGSNDADLESPGPMIDVKAAARFIGVSPSLVYAYVERKQIPHYRLGRAIRFRRSELDAWLGRFRVSGGIL